MAQLLSTFQIFQPTELWVLPTVFTPEYEMTGILLNDTGLSELAAAATDDRLLIRDTSAGHDKYIKPASLTGFISVKYYGALGDGATNDAAAFTSLFASTSRDLCIPYGSYVLGSNVTPSLADTAIRIDPAASFSGAGELRFNSLIPHQITDIWSNDLVVKTFDSTYSSYSNIFLRAAYAKVTHATPNTVAVFGEGDAAATGANAWGGNFVGVATDAGTAIGCEINAVNRHASGTVYGVVIASAGEYAVTAAVQIQSNTAASQFANGVDFNYDATLGCITGSLIYSAGAASAACTHFINISTLSASTAEIDIPSFQVSSSVASTTGKIQIVASSSGNPRVGVTGSATNINLGIRPKGTGAVQIQDGSANVIISCSSTGIGFFDTLTMDAEVAPSTPASGKAIPFVDSVAEIWCVKNDAGRVLARSSNAAVASQGAGFDADTYVTNSDILIPSFQMQAKTIFRWVISVSKTAASTATPVFTIRIGADRTTADTARLAITGPAQTAAADVAVYTITATVRSVGSGTSGVIQGTVSNQHTLASTAGFANTDVEGTSAGFDNSDLDGSYIGLSINGGTAASWTLTQVVAEAIW